MLRPSELVLAAQHVELTHLALTDHDQLAGIAEANDAGRRAGIKVIPGVELSVRGTDARTGRATDEHLLGWFVAPESPLLARYLESLQAARRDMAEETMRLLSQMGMPLDRDRLADLADGAVITRPHVARAMVERGYVGSESEAFQRFLGSGKPAAPPRTAPSPEQGISAVRSAGGVLGLAHPVFGQEADWAEQLGLIPARLDQLQEAGLRAVECWYPDATPVISEQLVSWTAQRGLIPTGGSDFHGAGQAPFAPLGQVSVGGDVLDALWAARS